SRRHQEPRDVFDKWRLAAAPDADVADADDRPREAALLFRVTRVPASPPRSCRAVDAAERAYQDVVSGFSRTYRPVRLKADTTSSIFSEPAGTAGRRRPTRPAAAARRGPRASCPSRRGWPRRAPATPRRGAPAEPGRGRARESRRRARVLYVLESPRRSARTPRRF